MTMPSEKPLGLNHGTGENRRASKPLIEKRRRARINQSLAELKTLVIDSKKESQPQNTRPPKLEKADILEMTVAYVKNLHECLAQIHPPENDENGFKAGFSKCIQEIYQFLKKESSFTVPQKSRLLSHLTNVGPNFNSSSESISIQMDDSASCYSGSSSRSNTPSSAVNEPTSMEYLPCSPYSDCTQEGSFNSSSPSSTSRTSFCKNPSSNVLHSSNVSNGNRSPSRVSPSNVFPNTITSQNESDPTYYNMNRPLNLASSSRTIEKSDRPHNQYEDPTVRNRIAFNGDGARGNNDRRENMPENAIARGQFVFRSNMVHNEQSLMQVDPVWRPW